MGEQARQQQATAAGVPVWLVHHPPLVFYSFGFFVNLFGLFAGIEVAAACVGLNYEKTSSAT